MIAPLERFTRPIFWLEQIPQTLKPDDDKVVKLENLRKQYGISNKEFVVMILNSPIITRKVQDHKYSRIKEQMPNASEKELLEILFRQRLFTQSIVGGVQLTQDEIQVTLQNINSLEDLKQYVVQMDEKQVRFLRDPFGIGKKVAKKINEILAR
jgi:hypothetical protein